MDEQDTSCACGATLCAHRSPSARCPEGPEPQYGGDLFSTNCEEGRHAWRVDWEAEGHPVACKWCDKPRYAHTEEED